MTHSLLLSLVDEQLRIELGTSLSEVCLVQGHLESSSVCVFECVCFSLIGG